MRSSVTRREARPPHVTGPLEAMVMVLGSAAGLLLLLSVVALASVVIGARASGGPVEAHPGRSVVLLLPAVLALAVVATGLWRRQRWAWWALILEVVTAIGLVTWSIAPIHPVSTDPSDSAGMAGGMAMLGGLGLIALLVVLLIPAVRRSLGPAPPGWYSDPDRRGLRWWDGQQWGASAGLGSRSGVALRRTSPQDAHATDSGIRRRTAEPGRSDI